MKFFYLIILLMISVNTFAEDRKDIMMVKRHVNDFAAKMSKKGYYLFGSGGEMMTNINKISLIFDLQKQVDVEEARMMLIQMSDEFLSEISADEKLRPYLGNVPFDQKNLSFAISFIDNENCFLEQGVAFAKKNGDNISYSESKGGQNSLRRILEENYEEAVQKMKQKIPDKQSESFEIKQ